jgi:hypothetical protein
VTISKENIIKRSTHSKKQVLPFSLPKPFSFNSLKTN